MKEEIMKILNKEKVLNILGIIWTSIIIFIYILKPSNYTYMLDFTIIERILALFGLGYILLNKFYFKNKIINNKFDIWIVIFLITMVVPIITNTYVSLHSSLQYIFKYSVFIMLYFIVKSLAKKENILQIILNILLIAISLRTVYGIDSETTKFINNIMGLIEYKEEAEYNIYKFNYLYHNILAIIMLAGICISQYKIQVVGKSKKLFIYIAMLYSSVGFYLAFSRISIIAFVIFETIALILCIKNKIRINDLISFYITFIMAVIFSYILKQRIFAGSNLQLWLVFIAITLLSVIVCKIIDDLKFRFKKFNIKINLGKIMPLIVCLGVVLVIFLVIILKTSAPIYINKNNLSDVGARFYTVKGLEKGTKHYFAFDVEMFNTNASTEVGYDIAIFGVLDNGVYKFINSREISRGTTQVDFMIENKEEYNEIKIAFKNKYNNDSIEDLTINLFQINGEEYILNYKYIPYSIVYFINSISTNNVSINERINIYKDASKMCIDNKFIGKGYDAWHYLYPEYKSYNYYTTQVHSRIFEILINYGLLGLIVYITVCVYYILNLIKIFKNDSSYILISIIPILIFIQSSIDWVMFENAVIVIMAIMLGIINSKMTCKTTDSLVYKIIEYTSITIFGIVVIFAIWISTVELYAHINNKEDTDMYNKVYISDYLVFRDDERISKIVDLQYAMNDSEEITNIVRQSIYQRLKYERGIDTLENMIMYLQTSKSSSDIDIKLMELSVQNSMPQNKYCVKDVWSYIKDLDYIKKLLPDIDEVENLISIINKKMIKEYEEIYKNIEIYEQLDMRWEYTEKITKQNIQLALDYIDECKKICYNE